MNIDARIGTTRADHSVCQWPMRSNSSPTPATTTSIVRAARFSGRWHSPNRPSPSATNHSASLPSTSQAAASDTARNHGALARRGNRAWTANPASASSATCGNPPLRSISSRWIAAHSSASCVNTTT